jgi:hypothetical protein
VAATTSDETKVLALAGRAASGKIILWLVNLTAGDVPVDISALRREQFLMAPYAIARIS